MSTRDKTPKPAKVKRVRQLIPVNAIVWVPGTELPPTIQRLIDDKIEAWAKEYDDVQTRRLKDFVPPAPTTNETIVRGLFYQLSGVNHKAAMQSVGLFIQRLKDVHDHATEAAFQANESAAGTYEKTLELQGMLNKILAGTLQIAEPVQTFKDGANLKSTTSTHNGEAVVSKRVAN